MIESNHLHGRNWGSLLQGQLPPKEIVQINLLSLDIEISQEEKNQFGFFQEQIPKESLRGEISLSPARDDEELGMFEAEILGKQVREDGFLLNHQHELHFTNWDFEIIKVD